MIARCSFDTDPWWALATSGAAPSDWPDCAIWSAGVRVESAASPGSRPSTSTPARSAASSFSLAVSRSASRRELAKTIVEVCCSIRSSTRLSTWGHSDPARGPSSPSSPSWVMSSTGTTTLRSHCFSEGGATTSTAAEPPRKRATSSIGRTVAESPIRCAGRASRWSSRSSETARWAPRLVPATACTSSMITVCTPRSDSRAWEVSIKNSDSGVVIKMSGGAVWIRRRSAGEVSPERTPTRISGTATPRRSAVCRMPTRGARRLRSTSTASALSGEM